MMVVPSTFTVPPVNPTKRDVPVPPTFETLVMVFPAMFKLVVAVGLKIGVAQNGAPVAFWVNTWLASVDEASLMDKREVFKLMDAPVPPAVMDPKGAPRFTV